MPRCTPGKEKNEMEFIVNDVKGEVAVKALMEHGVSFSEAYAAVNDALDAGISDCTTKDGKISILAAMDGLTVSMWMEEAA